MKNFYYSKQVLFCGALLLLCGTANTLFARSVVSAFEKKEADPRLGMMELLPGYEHTAEVGACNMYGKIHNPNALTISYLIGHVCPPGQPRVGGAFIDHPKNTPAKQRKWYKEQIVDGQPMHSVYKKDGNLQVSFPETGMIFTVEINNEAELVEALLMIMTYTKK